MACWSLHSVEAWSRRKACISLVDQEMSGDRLALGTAGSESKELLITHKLGLLELVPLDRLLEKKGLQFLADWERQEESLS
jgi:hypothetical protein